MKTLSLIPKLNPLLVKLLAIYYDPFISATTIDNNGFHYSVYYDGELIGILEVSQGSGIQIAVMPKMSGKGYGRMMLRALLNKVDKFDQFTYNVNPANYPSLKLLYDSGGGLQSSYVNEFVNFHGFLRRDGNIDDHYKQLLKKELPAAKERYLKMCHVFNEREDVYKIIKNFLDIEDYVYKYFNKK